MLLHQHVKDHGALDEERNVQGVDNATSTHFALLIPLGSGQGPGHNVGMILENVNDLLGREFDRHNAHYPPQFRGVWD